MRVSHPIPFWRIARQSVLRVAPRRRAVWAQPHNKSFGTMIADLPPMQAMEPHCTRNNGSVTQYRTVQQANGTALFVLLVCKAFDYGAVSARRIHTHKYTSCGYSKCIHGRRRISNYVLWQCQTPINFLKVAYVCLIWKLGLLRISRSDPHSSWVVDKDRWYRKCRKRPEEVRERSHRRPRDLLLCLLVVYNMVSLFWCRFMTKEMTSRHVWMSRNGLRK